VPLEQVVAFKHAASSSPAGRSKGNYFLSAFTRDADLELRVSKADDLMEGVQEGLRKTPPWW